MVKIFAVFVAAYVSVAVPSWAGSLDIVAPSIFYRPNIIKLVADIPSEEGLACIEHGNEELKKCNANCYGVTAGSCFAKCKNERDEYVSACAKSEESEPPADDSSSR